MQSIEIVVYLSFAILAGFLIIGFITGFDFRGLQESLWEILSGEGEKGEFEKVTYVQFLERAIACWNSCSFGKIDSDCGLYHVALEDSQDFGKKLTKQQLQADFNKFNICEKCNITLNPAELELPGTFQMGCKKATEALVIEG